MSPRQQGGVAKMSPMRLVNWAKSNKESESTMAEINRKMQRALEESMMKNIHLQQVCAVYRLTHDYRGSTRYN